MQRDLHFVALQRRRQKNHPELLKKPLLMGNFLDEPPINLRQSRHGSSLHSPYGFLSSIVQPGNPKRLQLWLEPREDHQRVGKFSQF
jgi:hypothetical protein